MEQGQRHSQFVLKNTVHSPTPRRNISRYLPTTTRGVTKNSKNASSNISYIITHQIFSLARDWSKRVTWANISQLKLGNIRGYSPVFTVFLELRSRKTVRFSEQIMSADKYPSIFSRQMKAIVYYLSNSSDAGIFMRK